MPISKEEIAKRFTYHPPKDEQPAKYSNIRAYAKCFAEAIVEQCPDGREQALALTKLEEVVMWANASIARN